MPEPVGPLAGAGQPRRREEDVHLARRVGAWVVWWVLLMAFWMLLDDSLALGELLAGAGAAALGASLAELAQYQAATHFRIRVEWTTPALGLPLQVLRDLLVVFAALWRRLVHGEEPDSGFRTVAVAAGGDSTEDLSRRVLLIGGRSVAPNTIVLGVDQHDDTMVIHQLVRGPSGQS